jgi:cell division protein FtsB
MPLFRLPGRFAFWVMLLVLGAGFFFLTVHGYQGMRQIQHLAQKREGLIRENQELNKKNESLYREITRLKQDPLYLEEVARKEFGLVKPNEIIFFIDDEKKKETPSHGKSPAPDHRR